MDLKNKVFWLRLSYWIGAIIDGFVAIQMLLPDFWASFNSITSHKPSLELNYALIIGASLMLGWTILLLWADRKPVERKGILLITVMPVISGLMLNNIQSVTSGLKTVQSTIPTLIVQLALVVLFLFSYWNAHKANG
jgi:hypothetical protein